MNDEMDLMRKVAKMATRKWKSPFLVKWKRSENSCRTLTDTSNLARVLHRRSRCNRCKFLFYSHFILTLPGLYLDILEVKNKLASNILSTSLFKHYIYLALIFSYLVSRSAMTGVSVLLFAFLLLCCYNFHLESHQVESKLSSIVD